jgi:hypothetical protein
VEYSFRNSLAEEEYIVTLKMYSIMIVIEGREQFLPYAGIGSVSMVKEKGNVCRTILESDNYPTLRISNKYFHESGEWEDRSAEYERFIRALHVQLKVKSQAVYSSGFSVKRFLVRALLVTLFSALISFFIWLAGLSVINPVILALILSLISSTVIFVLFKGKLPKEYSPSQIPVSALP